MSWMPMSGVQLVWDGDTTHLIGSLYTPFFHLQENVSNNCWYPVYVKTKVDPTKQISRYQIHFLFIYTYLYI